MAAENFPLTHLIADTIRMEQGQMTKSELRENWRNGKYAGVNPAHAKWYVEGR